MKLNWILAAITSPNKSRIAGYNYVCVLLMDSSNPQTMNCQWRVLLLCSVFVTLIAHLLVLKRGSLCLSFFLFLGFFFVCVFFSFCKTYITIKQCCSTQTSQKRAESQNHWKQINLSVLCIHLAALLPRP